MKRLMVVAALALSGCVAGQEDAPVQFTSALALSGTPGTECVVDSSKYISRGRLNLVGGGNYTIAMQVRSIIPIGRVVAIGGSNISIGGEAATLTEYVYTYQGPAELKLPKEETVATYTVIKAGASDGYVFVNAFGPKALASIYDNFGQLANPPAGIIATIKARGRLGTTSNLESNEFSFPVSIDEGRCPSGSTLTSVCNPGQDYSCRVATSTP